MSPSCTFIQNIYAEMLDQTNFPTTKIQAEHNFRGAYGSAITSCVDIRVIFYTTLEVRLAS